LDRIAHLVECLLLLARAQAGVLRMDHQTGGSGRSSGGGSRRLRSWPIIIPSLCKLGPLEPVAVHAIMNASGGCF